MSLLALREGGRTLAAVLQFVVPGLLLLSQALHLARRNRRRRQARRGIENPAADTVDEMDWDDFLQVMVQAYRMRGWEVTVLDGAPENDGANLALSRDNKRHLVSCQHWRARRVGATAVQKIAEAMDLHGATGGWLVSAGEFTPEAQRFAEMRGIRLVDGPALSVVLEKVGPLVMAKAA